MVVVPSVACVTETLVIVTEAVVDNVRSDVRSAGCIPVVLSVLPLSPDDCGTDPVKVVTGIMVRVVVSRRTVGAVA